MGNLFLLINVPTNVYSMYYEDPASHSLIYCKLRLYFGHTFGQTSRYCFVLACIDRYALTKIRSHFQFISNASNAKYLVCILIVFWHIFAFHIPTFATIKNGQCATFDLYSIIFYTYVVISVGFMTIIPMGVFGYLAYYNMRQLHRRIRPIEINRGNRTVRRHDRDLLITVLAEVIVGILMLLPYLFILFATGITNYLGMSKSVDYDRIGNFIQMIFSFLYYLNHGARFYIFFGVSKVFRRDFKARMKTIFYRT
jgi:hypothetical protein